MKSDLKKFEKKHIMQTYKRADILFESGYGCYVYDSEGKKYLDFIGGIATCSVGHGNAEVAGAIYKQAKKLAGVSNLYYMEPQILLAKKLSELSGFQKSFFCHSGADSNETAIKLAKKITGKKHFIAFKQGFHGRTTGSLALTWKQDFKEPFLPLAPDVSFAEYGDIGSVKNLLNDNTAAIIVEPIQGEAGVVEPGKGFLKKLNKLCREHQALLIVDEVQTGVGRTGRFFAFQHENIKPDIVTIAKGLANGLPIGVCLSDYELGLSEHGSTLGGNNISAAAALATIKYIEKHGLIKNAEETGSYFMDRLKKLKKEYLIIHSVRGKGLMIGIELNEENAQTIVNKCLKAGLLCNAPTKNVIRFLPPLTASKKQVDDCIKILKKALA
jgi:predicted acetylornithine/succinylornithine family transaminase